MKLIYSLLCAALFLTATPSHGQVATIAAGEYNKEVSLYRSKAFLMSQVLGVDEAGTIFQVYALSAASSGELTSLVYKCIEKHKEGLLLAFYGWQINPAGVRYQAYGFKDLPKQRALDLFSQLDSFIEKHGSYLKEDGDNNNLYFKFEDMVFLISAPGGLDIRFRVFWGDFDSEWNIGSFRKTKSRMGKRI